MAEQMDKIGKKMKKYSYWLDTVDQDFLKDNYSFKGNGKSKGLLNKQLILYICRVFFIL